MPGGDLDMSTIGKGDVIEVGNRGAFVVARVNRKTFSVYSGFYEGHTMTYRKEEVTAHRPQTAASTATATTPAEGTATERAPAAARRAARTDRPAPAR